MMNFDYIAHWSGWIYIVGALLAIALSCRIYMVSRRLKRGSMAGISRVLQCFVIAIIFPLVLLACGFLISAYHFFRCAACGTLAGMCGKELIPSAVLIDAGLVGFILAWAYLERALRAYKMI